MLYFKFFTRQNKIQLFFLPTMNKLNWVFYSLYMTCIVFLLQVHVYQALKMYTSSFIHLMYIILYSLNIFLWCRWYVYVKKKSWEGVLSRIPVKINRLSRYCRVTAENWKLGVPSCPHTLLILIPLEAADMHTVHSKYGIPFFSTLQSWKFFFPSHKSFVCDWMFPFRWIIVSLYCPFQNIVNDFCCNNHVSQETEEKKM